MKIDKISTETKYAVEMTEGELAAMYELIDKQVNGQSKCTNTQIEIYNNLYPLFTEPVKEKSQIDILRDYILEFCPEEIVEGGVANTAIKLIERLISMSPRKTETSCINSSKDTDILTEHELHSIYDALNNSLEAQQHWKKETFDVFNKLRSRYSY